MRKQPEQIAYGTLERDLVRLVNERVTAAVMSVLQLTETTGQAYLVTLTAANIAAGLWSGAFSAHHDQAESLDLPEALEALAQVMRESDGPTPKDDTNA